MTTNSYGRAIWVQGSKLVILAFALWIVLQGLRPLVGLLLLLVAALVLALAISPILRWARHFQFPPNGWRMPTIIIVLGVYALLLLIIGGAILVVLTPLITELLALLQILPQEAEPLQSIVSNVLASLIGQQALTPLIPDARAVADVASFALQALSAVVGGLVQFGLIIILSIFTILEGPRAFDFVVSLISTTEQEETRRTGHRIAAKIGNWALGELALAIIVGTLTTLGMMVIGVPFPLLLGIGALILVLAPAVGEIFVAIPAVLLGLTISPMTAFLAGAYMVVLSQIDAHILTPFLLGKAIDLSPLLILTALLIGATLFGVLGALLAVPMAAAIQVVTVEVIVPRIRQRNQSEAGEQDDPHD